ncbi:MAG: fasciclin domain-containing protein [Acidimicrobiales bacterium]
MPGLRKTLAAAVAGSMLVGGAALPAAATGDHAPPHPPPHAPGIVETVIAASGAEGFDHNPYDYDLLREALIATGLVDALSAATDITVFAPKDWAFLKLANDLGYEGSDEAGAFAFLAEATGFVSADEPGILADVLLYHVVPGARDSAAVQGPPLQTLLAGATIDVDGLRITDNDPNADDATIQQPFDLVAKNGIIHTIDRVLRPIDLPPTADEPVAKPDHKPEQKPDHEPEQKPDHKPEQKPDHKPEQKPDHKPEQKPDHKPEPQPEPEPLPSIVDVVVGASGGEGFDKNRKDYDILREALVATRLIDAVAASSDMTVFAPNDRAFMKLARSLGFKGKGEARAFVFLAEATGFVSADNPGLLDDVLLYHVSPGAGTVRQIQGERTTLLAGATITVERRKVIDADPDNRDARIRRPANIETSNGIIHTVNQVLRPLDLP